ncbi:winged helix-turn-helix domain-containing protein [Arthrobacter sp. ISL-5]|uniref:winged helix-turn-helix domain-containing protein n=1 Tax=Arthrobacter sp. ISL-5 TaxID=2819111 RepID=UPI001BEAB2C1|nr:winged helix-turn-helix domain-containing protein [Arthrobacter sp. ISL-5]MBT2551591.1 winged helix-turn-helix transcriptional regulator [Arthrobacter sp. ISL-5]
MPIPAGQSTNSDADNTSISQPLRFGIVGPTRSSAISALPDTERSRRREGGQRIVAGWSEENSVWGFALYMGIDESAARSAGTSVCALVRDIRAFGQSLVPGLECHAAVALGPANAPGGALKSVFSALGHPMQPAAPATDAADRGRGGLRRPEGIRIDVSGRRVYLDGDPVRLTRVEFSLMAYLIGASLRAVGRDELLRHIWGDSVAVPADRTIDVHIRRLRNKLGRFAMAIRTERGAGYRFHAHPEIIVFTPDYVI